MVIDSIKKAAKRSIIEATPKLRDNPIISNMLVTGDDTHINSAKHRFEIFYKRVKADSPVPIKLISISLFRFDLGATLARKFIDELLNDLCQKQGDRYTYQGIPVDIQFAGFFDCSCHTPASSKNGLGEFLTAVGGFFAPVGILLGEKSIDQESPLNPAVKKSLHLVAAHENRLWRTLYRLGGESANHREELLPGCSEDIGGGLKPDEQQPSAELYRVALQKMYREATMAGRRYILPDIYEPGYRRANKFLSYARAASMGKPIPLPDDYAPGEIFSYFVHDIQALNPSASIAEEFFLIRLFDDMEA